MDVISCEYDVPMAFKRFSIRGFRSDFSLRRQVETYGASYLCWATLYSGKHFRRKIDERTAAIPVELGIGAAYATTHRFKEELELRYGLAPLDPS